MIKTKKQRFNTAFVTKSAIIAALYVILTLISSSLGLSSGVIQIRLSEALIVLTFFTPCAIPGLTIGCFLANLITGACILDIIFGALATLIGATISYYLVKNKYLVALPNIISNMIIVPFILRFGYGIIDQGIPYMILTVGIGELISSGIMGTILLKSLEKHKATLF